MRACTLRINYMPACNSIALQGPNVWTSELKGWFILPHGFSQQ